jgi:hypothetical protein
MSNKFAALLAGVSFLALAGAANAADLTPLSTSQMDMVSAAGDYSFDTDVDKEVNIDVTKNYDFDAELDSDVTVDGNLATAEASADAYGEDTFTEASSFTQTTDWSSQSFSESTSASDGCGCYHY